jgi:hypothetical protein
MREQSVVSMYDVYFVGGGIILKSVCEVQYSI